MDNRLVGDATQLKEIIDRAMFGMNTCIPGIIDFFDAKNQTATVIPAILMKTFIDGEKGTLEYPPIINAPVVFPFASKAGFALTIPIRRGDPCIILFSQRSIDNWHDRGGIQPSEDGVSSRHHDLTDAIVLMAAAPYPQVLGQWEGKGIQIRNRSGSSTVTVFDDRIVIDNATEVVIDTPKMTITGELFVDGDAVFGGNVSNTGVNISKTHTHSQGVDSDGNTQEDTEVPH